MTSGSVSITDYLASKNIRTFKASGPEITAHCFFCGRHARDKGRLYINTAEGVYYCQVCTESGTFRDIAKFFGDDPSILVTSSDADDVRYHRRRILNSAADVGHEMLCNNDAVLQWLLGKDRLKKQRGLHVETIEEAKLGFLGKGWSLTRNLRCGPLDRKHLKGSGLTYLEDGEHHREGDDFFRGPQVLIPYLSSANVVQMRARDWLKGGTEGRYYTGPGEEVRLYGTDDLRDADEAVIVEGEFDRLVLKQTLRLSGEPRVQKIAVVALAGAGAWLKPFADYFRNCKRVWIALDPDEAGRKGSVKVKGDLGARSKIVELPDDLPKCDWTEYLIYRGHTWRDAWELLQNAANIGRFTVKMSESIDAWQKQEANGLVLPTGFTQIDATIDGGGLRSGNVCVVAAKTSVGKTLAATQIVVNHKRMGLHVPTLAFSMELTRGEWAERMVRQHRFFEPHADLDAIGKLYDDTLAICDRNRLASRDVEAVVDEFVEDFGCTPALIIMDHLSYYARSQSGSSLYDRTTAAIQDMKTFAKDLDAVNLVPAQVSRNAEKGKPVELDDLRDSGAIEETADYAILMWRPDDALNPEQQAERSGAIQAQLGKNRRGNNGQRFKIVCALASLALVDPMDQRAVYQATQENRSVWSGKSYNEIREQYAQTQLAIVGDAS